MTKLKSSIITAIFPSTTTKEWEEGLEIFDDNGIIQITQHDLLFSAKIKCLSNDSEHKVSVKLHPSQTALIWSECSCSLMKKGTKTKHYCSHIISFLMELIFAQPNNEPNTQISKEISHSFLKIFDHGIEKIDYNNLNNIFYITIVLQHKRKITFCVLPEILMKSYEDNVQHPKLYKLLQKEETKGTCGLNISIKDQESFVLEKSIKILKNKPTKKSKNKINLFEFYNDSREELSNDYDVIPFNNTYIDAENSKVYIPKLGIISIKNKQSLSYLEKWPEKARLQKDKCALFFQENNLNKFCHDGHYVWTNTNNLKSFNVETCTPITKINLIGEENDSYIIDIDLKGESFTSSLQKILDTNRDFYYSQDNGWLKIPNWIKDFGWQKNAKGQLIVSTLDILKLKGTLESLGFVGEKNLIDKLNQHLEASESLNSPPCLDFSGMKLRPYQQEGYNWLWWLYQNNLHGLLADDMGLGKTHQALALFSGIYIKNKDKQIKHLVVCPSTVLDHWQDKLQTYSPYLKSFIYHGYSRSDLHETILNSSCVVLTTYGIIMRDLKFLSQISWQTLILDEAHFVKNDKTAAYKSVCSLNSKFRLCLTGTPLENNLSELKTLFDFILPGYLGTRKNFRENFLQPIELACEVKEKDLKRIIAPFKLRRTKDQVLQDLPEKVEDIRFCHLSDEQKTLYQQILEQKGKPLIEKIKKSKDNESLPNMHILSIIQTLKQLTDHPALIKKDIKNYKQYTSGKFELLKQILEEAINSNHKVVIFSQFLGMIDIIKRHCEEQKVKVVTLTGSTKNRGQVIKQFQTDPDTKIFVGSLLAGGMGIDLTSASIVIHYDRWWNPSKENQATDRAHRIGQKNCVQVFKLISKNSLEENIDKLIAKKSDLFSRFLEGDKKQINWLNKEDVLELLDKSKIN
jgi:SNF2 family DNA or RNA helicase